MKIKSFPKNTVGVGKSSLSQRTQWGWGGKQKLVLKYYWGTGGEGRDINGRIPTYTISRYI